MLNITLIQSSLFWEDIQANLNQFANYIDSIQPSTDIILLPEMFSTGFSMNPAQYAESMDGLAVQWMKEKAIQKGVAIAGSLMIKENNQYLNRFVFMFPDGHYVYYDKRHLFRMGEENQHYTAGKHRLIIEYKGYKILAAVCYDLRFPVWLRRTKKDNYDVMLLVANWPERRNHHWKNLIQARAIENQCYVAAVNRIGEDGNGVAHSGDSALINAKGEILFQEANTTFVKSFTIDKLETNTYRAAFNVIEDADDFSLNG